MKKLIKIIIAIVVIPTSILLAISIFLMNILEKIGINLKGKNDLLAGYMVALLIWELNDLSLIHIIKLTKANLSKNVDEKDKEEFEKLIQDLFNKGILPG